MELVGVINIYDANGNLIDFLIGDIDTMASASSELKVPIANLTNLSIEYKVVEPESEVATIAKRLFAKIDRHERNKSD